MARRLLLLASAAGLVVMAILVGASVQPGSALVSPIAIGQAGESTGGARMRAALMTDPAFSGTWIDAVGTVQVRLVSGSDTTASRELLSGITSSVVADRKFSYAALQGAMARIDSAQFTAESGIVSMYVDEQTGAIEVTALPNRMKDAQTKIDVVVGNGKAVVGPGQITGSESGPDRYRDRYPYAGASSISLGPTRSGQTRKRCSTAFPLQRAGGGKSFLLTAAHCTEAWEGKWTGSGYSPNPPFQENPYAFTASTAGLTLWANYIGTNSGYGDSVCPSSQPSHRLFSCGDGSASYSSREFAIVGAFPGDVAIVKVAGVQPYIWTSSIKRSPIYYAQASDPMVGDPTLCFSGQTSGAWCGLTVRAVNVSSWSCSNTECATHPTDNNRHYIQGRTMATKSSGKCTQAGDSGGAVYKPARSPSGAAGAVRAVGVHNGSSTANYCTIFFTPVWRAVSLFSAPVARR